MSKISPSGLLLETFLFYFRKDAKELTTFLAIFGLKIFVPFHLDKQFKASIVVGF